MVLPTLIKLYHKKIKPIDSVLVKAMLKLYC